MSIVDPLVVSDKIEDKKTLENFERWKDILNYRVGGDNWDDQQVQTSGVRLPDVNAPSFSTFKGCEVLTFSGSATNTIYFSAQLSHAYEEGSNIEFHVHYVPEDNTSGNVRWVFTYSWANINGVFLTETPVTTVLATPQVTDQHTKGEIITAITGTGKNLSSILLCSLSRTGGHTDDTYDSKNIYLIGIDFHIKKDALGSQQERSK